jgi:hypothetical protein
VVLLADDENLQEAAKEMLPDAKAHCSPTVGDGGEIKLVVEGEEEGASRRRRCDDDDAAEALDLNVEEFDARKAQPSRSALPGPPRITIFFIIALSFGFLITVVYVLPPLLNVEEGDKFLWRPRSARDFELDRRILTRYRDEYAWQLFLGMAAVFIILQTLCVPASGTTMNVLAGCIFSETLPSGEYLIALPMGVLCVSIGAVMCYLISYLSFRELVTVIHVHAGGRMGCFL